MYLRQQFLEHVAQTSEIPQGFEIERAQGCFLYHRNGEKYLDFLSGFGVSNIGYGVPEVIEAIRCQSEQYLHSNVYGEHIQSPQVALAEYLTSLLPASLNSVYFLSSGSEAVDAAIKLARLSTGRNEIVVCRNAYHGSTLGAEALRSDEAHKDPFRPVMSGIRFIDFGSEEDLDQITSQSAAVFTEVVQAEAGVRTAPPEWWKRLRNRCEATGTLLALDEIQTGIGRTGKLFAFQHEAIVPDILISGKALGAGMPLSAVIAGRELMQCFWKALPLGHISTFGGHPVSCAAGLAGLKYLLHSGMMEAVSEKAEELASGLKLPAIREFRHKGLLMAVEMDSQEKVMEMIRKLYEQKILAESFLFCPTALRLAPPLAIRREECHEALKSLLEIL